MRMGDYMEILNRNGLRASYADSWLVENAQAVQVMEQRIAELEDRNALLDGNFEISSNIAIGLAERYQQELVQARQRIAELEAQLTAMEENFQAVRRDRDELEQELLGLKHWQPA